MPLSSLWESDCEAPEIASTSVFDLTESDLFTASMAAFLKAPVEI